MPGEAAHVHFVDDGPSRRSSQRRIAFPIVCRWVHDYALHRCLGIVTLRTGTDTTVVFRHHNRAAVRIEQHFG